MINLLVLECSIWLLCVLILVEKCQSMRISNYSQKLMESYGPVFSVKICYFSDCYTKYMQYHGKTITFINLSFYHYHRASFIFLVIQLKFIVLNLMLFLMVLIFLSMILSYVCDQCNFPCHTEYTYDTLFGWMM